MLGSVCGAGALWRSVMEPFGAPLRDEARGIIPGSRANSMVSLDSARPNSWAINFNIILKSDQLTPYARAGRQNSGWESEVWLVCGKEW